MIGLNAAVSGNLGAPSTARKVNEAGQILVDGAGTSFILTPASAVAGGGQETPPTGCANVVSASVGGGPGACGVLGIPWLALAALGVAALRIDLVRRGGNGLAAPTDKGVRR